MYMTSLTLAINDNLKTRMNEHPEINWSHVARESIRSKLTELEIMDQLAEGIDLTDEEIDEIADEINQRATERAMRDLENRDHTDEPQ